MGTPTSGTEARDEDAALGTETIRPLPSGSSLIAWIASPPPGQPARSRLAATRSSAIEYSAGRTSTGAVRDAWATTRRIDAGTTPFHHRATADCSSEIPA